jgi:ATP-dependent RNA helicase RhlE
VDITAKSLKKYGYDAAPIHGDLDQSQRTRTLESFRGGDLRILVASDVAARGLDVPSVSHVFNFDVPGHPEDYVHRIGRTGRAGREGKAITICSSRDEKQFDAVESLIQKEIARLENPIKVEPRKPRKPKEDSAKPVEAFEPAKPVKEERPQREDRPKQDARPQREERQQRDDRGDKSARGRGRGRNDRRDNGNKVVGMGNHMPGFIAMSFDERRGQ